MAKSKLLELDIVRAIAILAVLLIHGTSEATVELNAGTNAQAVYLAINKLSNFAVPLFIFLSGLVLFYRYSDDWGVKQTVAFYRRRIQQIVLPYLAWSLFYYLYEQWLHDRANLHFDWQEFLDLLPWADAGYHLYFIIIIVQFYLLFPLLMWLVKASVWFRRLLWLLGIVIQGGFSLYSRYVEWIDHTPSLAVTYFSLFTIGGFIGLYYDRFMAWLSLHYRWIIPAAALSGMTFMMFFQIEARRQVTISGVWYELLFTLYPVLAAGGFIWIGKIMLARTPALSKALLALGSASFGIYLVHPAVLSYYRVHLLPGDVGSYHVYTWFGFALSLIVPWLLVLLYGKVTRPLLRKPKRA